MPKTPNFKATAMAMKAAGPTVAHALQQAKTPGKTTTMAKPSVNRIFGRAATEATVTQAKPDRRLTMANFSVGRNRIKEATAHRGKGTHLKFDADSANLAAPCPQGPAVTAAAAANTSAVRFFAWLLPAMPEINLAKLLCWEGGGRMGPALAYNKLYARPSLFFCCVAAFGHGYCRTWTAIVTSATPPTGRTTLSSA